MRLAQYKVGLVIISPWAQQVWDQHDEILNLSFCPFSGIHQEEWFMKRLIRYALILPLLVGCGGSGTSETAAVNRISPLDSPEILHVICFDYAGVNYLSVEWSHVPGATAYHVYLSEDARLDRILEESPLVLDNVTVYEGVITPRRIIGFQTGVQYFLVMTAVQGSEESLPSNTVWFSF
jgi:hypothetical protein